MNTSTSIETVTPAVASAILSSYQYDRQRNLRERKVDYLATEIMRGKLYPSQIVLAQREGESGWMLLDGQHRLQAIIRAEKPAVLSVMRCTGMKPEEVHDMYAHIDIGTRRGWSDQAQAYGLAESCGLTKTQAGCMSAAVEFILSGFKPSFPEQRLPPDVKAEQSSRWAHEFKMYAQMGEGYMDRMRRTPVIAVALATIRYAQADKVDQFWTQVCRDDGLRIGDPRKTLGKWLNTTGTQGGSSYRPSLMKMVRPASMARACALAWNAWYEGRDLKIIQTPKPTAPIIILGTMYDGTE